MEGGSTIIKPYPLLATNRVSYQSNDKRLWKPPYIPKPLMWLENMTDTTKEMIALDLTLKSDFDRPKLQSDYM